MKLFSKGKPKIKVQETKKGAFDGWLKCSHCKELIHTKELEHNLNCCPKCDHHYRLPAKDRIDLIFDEDSYEELFDELQPKDPLKFVDSVPYKERLKEAQKKTSRKDGVYTAKGTINGQEAALAVMDFSFMAGSMGSVVGEKITLLIEYATEKKLPLIIVAASGGARMQESILSLMQMAKTSSALARLSQEGLPFISVLTNPTTGGVTASFASLGDVIIAEPKALICFAGPRVIEQTIGQKLPDDAQKSEFLLKHGMIDAIVTRKEIKEKLSTYIHFLTENERASTKAEVVSFPDELAKAKV